MPPYGGSIAQQVYYADADLCDPNVDTTRGYPERKDTGGNRMPWQAPYILMVDRGGCTFVTQVRNAQRLGAAGVLIADNTCLCSDFDCMSKTGMSSTCESTKPMMPDDGSGADISIPSFLMLKPGADLVKEQLINNRFLQLQMSWSLPNPDTDDRVKFDIWTTPSDLVSKNFYRSFRPLAKALGKRALFTPHMYILDGIKMGCQEASGEKICYDLCTNNGRYCATDPDNDRDNGISGADVVRESLRRLCIWETYGNSDGIGMQFWDYVTEFNARCGESYSFANEDCIRDAYKHSSVDAKFIDVCLKVSGGTIYDAMNSLLSSEIKAQKERGVVVIPSAFINTSVISGPLTATKVFKAICTSFSEGTSPDICLKCGLSIDAPSCLASVDGDQATRNNTGGVSMETYLNSMLATAIICIGLTVWHYKEQEPIEQEPIRQERKKRVF